MLQEDQFAPRHIGARHSEIKALLEYIGFKSVAQFTQSIVPPNIRRKGMNLPDALTESQALAEIRAIAQQNKPLRSLIGQGYYATRTPSVILRNVLENPAWYTAYTPYQPEISQGRLEAMLNFQTMICDLTAMDIANASLLDEATAAAEAMTLAKRHYKGTSKTFVIDHGVHPQTIDVLLTRARYQDIDIIVADCYELAEEIDDCFGVLLQYPCTQGCVATKEEISELADNLHSRGATLSVACDLLSLTLINPPGEMGADIVIGSAQQFGVPLGYGGPHAAFMAVRDALKRQMPGRLVGVSVDSRGKAAYRLALQTREQHIRREKATSNICTAQALLAVMASSYAVYHGPQRLKQIAERVHKLTTQIAQALEQAGLKNRYRHYFRTLIYEFDSIEDAELVMQRGLSAGINFRRHSPTEVGFSLDECSSEMEAAVIIECFSNIELSTLPEASPSVLPRAFRRSSEYLSHPVFNCYHSETEMMRYLRRLADYDLALDRSMIPLGSCTMKLNAASEMMPITWREFSDIHPFAPKDQAAGYHQIFQELENWLAEITGYDAVSLQPNSGAQGEYAGLLAIREYHKSRGEERNICLIPASAHGTNPASAHLAGLDVVVVKCRDNGDVDIEDLRAKLQEHGTNTACIMVTYPSTHGVFEAQICEICEAAHAVGAQVYLDGANFNAQVGLAAPGLYGADVSHLNLHKTFAIPHGGGGPGVGPVAVKAHLKPFLPSHSVIATGHGGLAVSAAPHGSALITLISWMYIRMMGSVELTAATASAMINANYIAKRLGEAYPVLYSDANGYVAHECILDMRGFKDSAGIQVDDIAKRLIDYGFHAPTMSFPVPGTLMIEPTESESKAELDRFCDAMLAIREEIRQIENGDLPQDDNPLKNAPHTLADLVDDWTHPYDRKTAVFPLPDMNPAKYFAPVNRIDNAHGDRQLFCSCPPWKDDDSSN